MPGFQRSAGGVSQGRGSAQTLTREDAEAIATETSAATLAAAALNGRHQVTTRSANTNTSIIGTVPAYLPMRNVEMAEGSFFSSEQEKSAGRVPILGPVKQPDGSTKIIFYSDSTTVPHRPKVPSRTSKTALRSRSQAARTPMAA